MVISFNTAAATTSTVDTLSPSSSVPKVVNNGTSSPADSTTSDGKSSSTYTH